MHRTSAYFRPLTVKNALELADSNHDSFSFIAGGTDLMVNKHQQNNCSRILIDINQINELRVISQDEKFLRIGALVKLCELGQSSIIRAEFPGIIEAANSVGSPLIRQTATIGGNVMCENRCIFYNQSEWWRKSIGNCLKSHGNKCIATGGMKVCFSEFVSDTVPALIAMEAKVEIENKQGVSVHNLEEIFTGDGVNSRNIDNATILTYILLPRNKDYVVEFKKLRLRQSMEFTSLTSCVSKNNQGKVRVVLAGVDPKPVLVEGTIDSDCESLIKECLKRSRAVNNDTFSRIYRRKMIRYFLSQSFEKLLVGQLH